MKVLCAVHDLLLVADQRHADVDQVPYGQAADVLQGDDASRKEGCGVTLHLDRPEPVISGQRPGEVEQALMDKI